MSRIQRIATQNNQTNNQTNNQQEPHPGSLQHRNNIKNYIVYIFKNACKEPTSECKLWMLSLLGEDCFESEIIDRIEDYDCRTKQDIEEYYNSYIAVFDWEYTSCDILEYYNSFTLSKCSKSLSAKAIHLSLIHI